MGHVKRKSILILVVLFGVSAGLLHLRSEPDVPRKNRTLESTLSQIPGWQRLGPVALEDKIVRSLDLDDYINAAYTKDGEQITLYIGYYFSSGKVGAAHDPLVCFPGQGWRISSHTSVKLPLQGKPDLDCAMLVAERENSKQLVLYWFQAYDTPNSSTFRQKLALLWNKLNTGGQDNAFVRVSIALDQSTVTGRRKVAADFISSFYPILIEYVRDGNTV